MFQWILNQSKASIGNPLLRFYRSEFKFKDNKKYSSFFGPFHFSANAD